MLTGCSDPELLKERDFHGLTDSSEYHYWEISKETNLVSGIPPTRTLVEKGKGETFALTFVNSSQSFHAEQRCYPIHDDERGYIAAAHVESIAGPSAEVHLNVFGFIASQYTLLGTRRYTGSGTWENLDIEVTLPFALPAEHYLFQITARPEEEEGPVFVTNPSLKIEAPSLANGEGPPSLLELLLGYVIAIILLVTVAGVGIKFRNAAGARGLMTVIHSLIVIWALFFGLLTAELFARCFLVNSDSAAVARVAKIWWRRYWNPINDFGYRDEDHSLQDFE
ncbi:MAG: hypothetical protein KC964_19120, partial [Candidatus Omnitrophica bacterium]|nr:hypothetical protein [Candidatus Omnitrophota bacterium]